MDRPQAGGGRRGEASRGQSGRDVRALHATSGHDVDYRLYFICENGRRILPVDKPSVLSGAFNGGVNPLVDCEPVTASSINELTDTAALLPAVEASAYLFK